MQADELIAIQNELSILATTGKPAARAKVASNPFTRPNTLGLLDRESNPGIRQALAGNPNTPVDILHSLGKSSSSYVKAALAENPNTPAEILTALSKTKDNRSYILDHLVKNRAITADMLQTIANTCSANGFNTYWVEELVIGIVCHPNTPAYLRSNMLNSSSETCKADLTRNENAPSEALLFISKTGNDYLRRCLVSNPKVPAEILLDLATNGNHDLKHLMADPDSNVEDRVKLPMDVLRVLAKDSDIDIKCAALESIAAIEGVSVPAAKPAVLIETKPYTPPDPSIILSKEEALREFLESGDEATRQQAVAVMKDPVLLAELAKDPSVVVRIGVACNLYLDVPTQLKIVQDADESVRTAFIESHPPKSFEEAFLLVLKTASKDSKLRICNRTASTVILTALAKDSDRDIRERVARDSGTPQEAIQMLARDPDPAVRFNAALRIKAPEAPKPEPKTESIVMPLFLAGAAGVAGALMSAMGKSSVRVEMPAIIAPIEVLAEVQASA